MQKLFFIILFLIPLQVVLSQSEKEAIITNKINWMAYPYAFYTPETQLAFGAGSLVYFRTKPIESLKPSKVLFTGYYTTNDQYFIKLAPTLYFAGADKMIIKAEVSYAREIMKFYGIGNNTPEIPDPNYNHSYFQIKSDLIATNIISQSIYTGFSLDYSLNDIYDTENNSAINDTTQTIYGKDGGTVSGLGWTFLWDNRDNTFFPAKNGYYEIKAFFFGKFLGGKFNYNQFIFDFRHYFEVAPSHILAVQGYFEGTTGEVPFYKLPTFGGSNKMRGYFWGRYRDKRVLVGQIEYRKIIWWRIGIVAFFGIGDVGPDLKSLEIINLKSSYGFGLRYVFDENEKLNVRVDIGFGKDTNGIYFGLEEAF